MKKSSSSTGTAWPRIPISTRYFRNKENGERVAAPPEAGGSE
ncbi:MAG: hypothetical protein V4659_03440 [Pseudomonadota bacterium]